MLTTNEIERIANAVNALRPDWPTKSLQTLIANKLANRTRRDVVVALAWVAAESESTTPARVLEAGPWWRATNQGGTVVRFPPRADQSCPKHPGQWPDNCGGCAADRLAGDTSDAGNKRRGTPERMGEIRHLLDVARSGFCTHGVDPERCADHNSEAVEREATRLAVTAVESEDHNESEEA